MIREILVPGENSTPIAQSHARHNRVTPDIPERNQGCVKSKPNVEYNHVTSNIPDHDPDRVPNHYQDCVVGKLAPLAFRVTSNALGTVDGFSSEMIFDASEPRVKVSKTQQ